MSADTRTRRTRLRPVHDRAHRRELRSIDLAVRLSPQGVGGVLDRSVAILRSDLGLLFGVGLAIWLPLRIVLIYQLRPRLPADTLGMVELSSLVLGTVLLAAFAARVVAARLARGSVEPGRVLALGPFEVLGLLVLAAVTSAAAGIGILMLLVGALVATWLLALAPVVYVLELEHGPVKRIGYALKRSVTLVAGSFWRWLAIFTVVKLLDLVLTLPMGFLDDPAQRLALARALAQRPRLLLLDEPLGPLDAPRRAALLERIHALQLSQGLTILHVTHDPGEADAYATRTLTLEAGRIAGDERHRDPWTSADPTTA